MRLLFNKFIQQIFIIYNALILDNINEQKQYSILKSIHHSFFEIIMGAKGWFKIYFFLFNFIVRFNDLFLLFSFSSESSMSPPLYDYDPFDSLRRSHFADEEYEHCFRYFDSQK
jgi:hypothetical protein